MSELYRLSGSGNDFLALVEPAHAPPAEQVRAWCRRGVSLGADGVFTVHRGAAAGDPPRPTVRMRHYNPDGGEAALCANGTRCAAHLAFELGWAEDAVQVVTGAGTYPARPVGEHRVALEVPPPAGAPEAVELEVDGATYHGHALVVGVPYLVLEWAESLAGAPVASLGARLRRHPQLGAAGANVGFARYPDAGAIELRTFERGVEAETLASGTGVLAAALTGLVRGSTRLPVEVLTASGLTLAVEGSAGAGRLPASWALVGDARLLARVRPTAAAELSVPAPAWSD